MVALRQISVNDVKMLAELSQKTFTETFAKDNTPEDLAKYIAENLTEDILLEKLSNKNSFFYVIEEENRPVGFLKLNINDAQTEKRGKDTLEIERIYLLQETKRKGYGKQLLLEAIKKAKLENKQQVWLGVWENNFPAKAFYKKQGFKKVGSHTFVLGNDAQTDEIMALDLEQL